MDVFTLPEFVAIMGEDKAKEALSLFSVARNPDVERFIKTNALIYQNHNNSRTYLIVNDFFRLSGYFTLSMTCMKIPENISNSLKKKMRGFGRMSADTVPCFLLGQLAREDNTPQGKLNLADILDMATTYAFRAQDIVGGRFLSVDCIDALVPLYEENGFQRVNRIGDYNQMIMFIGWNVL